MSERENGLFLIWDPGGKATSGRRARGAGFDWVAGSPEKAGNSQSAARRADVWRWSAEDAYPPNPMQLCANLTEIKGVRWTGQSTQSTTFVSRSTCNVRAISTDRLFQRIDLILHIFPPARPPDGHLLADRDAQAEVPGRRRAVEGHHVGGRAGGEVGVGPAGDVGLAPLR